ncbi:FHA domain-containing protein [Nitriliruptor alkaliphilus]|uniref:FHA domain-containing protein n=1 Tax=Nitriliruptor alkaliphilus TaxID=427918 RepID=UPI00069885ED|nr:FHA domain-containing protein [Nitriliruptor alkaliphilus]
MLPGALLTLLKFALLLALYIFLARAIRAVAVDLYGPRRRTAPPRPAVAAPAEPPRKARKVPREIVVHAPTGTPAVRPLGRSAITLGRAQSADVVVDDVYASDEHAQLVPDGDGGWSVRDLGSTNGTFLNGAKLTRPTPLAAGDQLRLGKTRVEVRR